MRTSMEKSFVSSYQHIITINYIDVLKASTHDTTVDLRDQYDLRFFEWMVHYSYFPVAAKPDITRSIFFKIANRRFA